MKVVAFMRELVAKGMSWEDAASMAGRFEESLEDAIAKAAPVRSPAAVRQAAYRDRKRNAEHNGVDNASDVTRVTPTPLPPALSPQTPLTHPPTPPDITTRARRASKIVAENWSPSVETMRVLNAEGHEAGAIERALTMMRDHEFRTARSDWDKTFRNWVREDAKRQPRKAHEQPHHDAKFDARQANLARAFAGADRAAGQRWKP